MTKQKKPAATASANDASKPLVAVVTPTYGRHRFLPWLIRMFNQQTYPQSRMVLIILDDGPEIAETDTKLLGLLKQPNIKYVRHEGEKLPIGAKRNKLNQLAIQAGADIIVDMDDDDYYPPNRVEHSVTALNRTGLQIAGSSVMYIYFADDGIIRKFGPYGPNHSTAGCFAFTRKFAEEHKYNELVAYAEESQFTDNFTQPMVQLDPFSTILCISHRKNTFDKTMIKNSGNSGFAKLKHFVKDKELCDFYKTLVQVQDANPEVLPSTQARGKIDLELKL